MSKIDVAAVVAFYAEGNSTKETAKKFDLQLHEVRTTLTIGGVTLRRGRTKDDQRAKLVRRLEKLVEEYGLQEVAVAVAELSVDEQMDIAA
jgi:transposase